MFGKRGLTVGRERDAGQGWYAVIGKLAIAALLLGAVLIWLDNFAIPAGAEHKENAYKFISYLMRPEVAKLCVEEFNYSTPNKAAEKILEPEYAESKVIILDPKEVAAGEVTTNVGKARELYEKYWEQLKAGD